MVKLVCVVLVVALLSACTTIDTTGREPLDGEWPPTKYDILLAIGLVAATTVGMALAVPYNTRNQIKRVCTKFDLKDKDCPEGD